MLPAPLHPRALSALTCTLGRPELDRSPPSSASTRWLTHAALITLPAAFYGAVMGSFQLVEPQHALLMLFGAIKVPLLIFATSLICLPGYFVLSTTLGLRRDFRAALYAIACSQAAMTIALASLAPITRFAYTCGLHHADAVLFNALMFTLATAVAQVVLLRRYRPLIAANPRHRVMLWSWLILYAFVGIQTGWMLRPFVGTPGREVTFLREEPFSNAYVVIVQLISR